MLALARRLNVVSSSKMTPSAELAEVLSISPLKISSLTLSAELAPLRVVVALPCTVTTVPKCKLDAEQGGATYVDKEVVLDGNIVTSRYWMDNAYLMREFLKMLKSR